MNSNPCQMHTWRAIVIELDNFGVTPCIMGAGLVGVWQRHGNIHQMVIR